ncbi:NADH-quinone oxidoreductase subunit C [Brevibacillus ginsengisoli]|uniref:NADH-quinone oxidoreductase subunit C n=1 Tax=Brevibacillus ginsengisoli TaxID=363854 RepID=UPI003CF637D3
MSEEKRKPTPEEKAAAAAAAKAKAEEMRRLKEQSTEAGTQTAAPETKASPQQAEESSANSDEIAKAKAAAAAKAKAAAAAAAAAKAKAAREAEGGATGEAGGDDADAKAKAAAAAKAKAAAAAAAKAKAAREAEGGATGEAGGDDDAKAKAAAAAKAKAAAAAAAKAKATGAADTGAAEETPKAPSKYQPYLDKYVKVITAKFGADVLEDSYINQLAKEVPTIIVKNEKLHDVAKLLKEDSELHFEYLSNLHGVDYENHMEVYYHLYSYKNRQSIAVKVKTNREKPSVASVMDIWAGANYNERETYDLLGINFPGHNDLRRIMLSDDWVGHPLRKDYVPFDEGV